MERSRSGWWKAARRIRSSVAASRGNRSKQVWKSRSKAIGRRTARIARMAATSSSPTAAGCSWGRRAQVHQLMDATRPRRSRLVFILSLFAGAMLALAAGPTSDLQPELRLLLARDLKFSSSDIADLERGRIAKRVLPANAAGEVAVVGGVRVHASKEKFVAAYRDIRRFKQGPDIVQIGRFQNPPQLDDLAPRTVVHEDVDLRECKVGDCDIRLPADVIARFQREIDWRRSDADAQAALLFKHVLFDEVAAYVSGGTGRIQQYDDDRRPVRPIDDFAGLIR